MDQPTADEVAASAAVWLRAARSPITVRVDLVQPFQGVPREPARLTITLRPDATAADAAALQASDSGLAGASWRLSLIANESGRPRDYDSTLRSRSPASREQWPRCYRSTASHRTRDEYGRGRLQTRRRRTLPARPAHVATPLETELSKQYEKC